MVDRQESQKGGVDGLKKGMAGMINHDSAGQLGNDQEDRRKGVQLLSHSHHCILLVFTNSNAMHVFFFFKKSSLC